VELELLIVKNQEIQLISMEIN